ncbi:MAG: thioredoxin family protein [Rhodoferax sp.]|jgi:thiol:disulfide interchange protein|nr:thioredoxin family protein [Rhodoferax sp.]
MFKRRSFLLSLALGMSLLMGSAHALTIKPFSATELAAAQDSGAAVAIHFHAAWCPTCHVQSQALQRLKTDPSLNAVTVLVANYDQDKALMKQLNVRSQSTLVVFKGKTEVVRDSGSTELAKLQSLLIQGL